MPYADELIADPWLGIDPITASTTQGPYDSDELRKFAISDTDIANLLVKVLNKGTKATRIDLRTLCTDAYFEDSIDKTPTFTVVVHDPDWELLNSGTLEKPIDLNPGSIPKLWYRLDGFEVNDDEITLTFATRNAVYLSYHKRPYKLSRGKVTRAEMILSMLKKVKVVDIPMYCPQLHKKQPTAKLTQTERTQRQRGNERAQGFTASDQIKVQGGLANPEQRKNIEDIIQAGIDKNAPAGLIIIALMVVAQESGAKNSATNGQFVGCFQQSSRYGWPATRNAYTDAYGQPGKHGFYDAAIPVYQKDPNRDFGEIGRDIQMPNGSWKGSATNRMYAHDVNRWRDEAEHSVNAFGGIDITDIGSATVSSTYRAKYEFSIGADGTIPDENYLAATIRFADEVNWRAYWVKDTLHFMSEEDLYKARARTRLRRFYNGVEKITFGWDHQKKVEKMSLSVRMEKWVCPVGTVIIFDEGGPAQGRWLVTNIRRSMFDQLGEIQLSKPMTEKLEPIIKATRSNAGDDSDTISTSPIPDIGDIEGTPKEIIDNVVIPMALAINPEFKSGYTHAILSPESVKLANDNHGHTVDGKKSDHEGPEWYSWAADMSVDWVDHYQGDKWMDELAQQLGDTFNIHPVSGGCIRSVSADGRYTFQICYLTNVGGDHYNHVHFGVRDNRANIAHPGPQSWSRKNP